MLLQDYILGEDPDGIAVERQSALVIGEHEQKESIRMDPRCKTLVLP